ncbi:MAG: pepsin/retropepsin-like aspartic protease family protein [Pseudomonadota bacterium]
MTHSDLLFERVAKATVTGLIVIICALLVQPAHATERQTLTLLDNERNWPITPIMVNGQASRALLDTGATIALIDDDLLAYDKAKASPYATQVRGIGGNRVLPVANVSSLSAGVQAWQDLRVAVNLVDAFPVQENILPVSLFEGAVIDFDFSGRTVSLYDGYPKRVRGAARNTIKYSVHDGLIFIPVSINGVNGHALIDTGSTVTFINAHFAKDAEGVYRAQAAQEIRGSDLSRNELEVFKFRRMQLGNKKIFDFSIPVLETELFAALGFEDGPMMVIGMDLLSHYRLQIDRKRQRIILQR